MRGNAYLRFLSTSTTQDDEGTPTPSTAVLWQGRAELMRGAERDTVTREGVLSRLDAATVLLPRGAVADVQALDGAMVQLVTTNEVARVVAVNPVTRHLHLRIEGPLTTPTTP